MQRPPMTKDPTAIREDDCCYCWGEGAREAIGWDWLVASRRDPFYSLSLLEGALDRLQSKFLREKRQNFLLAVVGLGVILLAFK